MPSGKSVLLFGALGARGSGEVSCANCGERWKLTKDDLDNPWRESSAERRVEQEDVNDAGLDEKWARWTASAEPSDDGSV